MDNIHIAIGVPSTGLCRIEFMVSVAQLMVRLMQQPVFPDVHRQTATLRVVQSSGISTNRELLVQECLAEGVTHLLFVDEDMTFPPDTVHRLIAHYLPFVAANYRLRTKGGDFCAMRLNRVDRVQTTYDATGLEECAFVGFGVALLDMTLFHRLTPPWFPTHWNPTHRRYSTEDQPFCERVRTELGLPIVVDHDVSKDVQHIGHYAYTWEDNGD